MEIVEYVFKIIFVLWLLFHSVMSQGLNQDQFLQQLEGIIEGVVKTKETVSIIMNKK